jgi:hypothetical protein
VKGKAIGERERERERERGGRGEEKKEEEKNDLNTIYMGPLCQGR